jgi:hypothetical protein
MHQQPPKVNAVFKPEKPFSTTSLARYNSSARRSCHLAAYQHQPPGGLKCLQDNIMPYLYVISGLALFNPDNAQISL